MKRNLGYDMRRAEKTFFDTADGTHMLHLIEVFERDGTDVTRLPADTRISDVWVGEAERWGELWLCDEDGYDEIVNAGWSYEGREAVGFDRDELTDIHVEEDMFRGDR